VSHCGDATREIAKKINKHPERNVEKIRLGELFGPDGRVLPYEFNVAFGTQILAAMARPLEDNLFSNTFMQGNHLMHEFLGNPEEVFSLENSKRKSYVFLTPQRNLSHTGSTERKSALWNPESLPAVEDEVSSDESVGSASGKRNNRTNKHATFDGINDYVVHTAIIRKIVEGGEFEMIAILTSKRFIILEHRNKHKGNLLKKKWEADLEYLIPPTIEIAEGDAGLVLNISLKGGQEHSFSRRRSFLNEFKDRKRKSALGNGDPLKSKHSSFKLKGNYLGDHIIINLYNCLNTLLGAKDFKKIDAVALSVCTEDEFGLRHIGPWQYTRKNNAFEKFQNRDQANVVKEREKIIKKLKFEVWQFPGTKSVENRPSWLISEEDQAIADQNKLKPIYSEIQLLENEFSAAGNKDKFEDLIHALRDRKISVEEFRNSIAESRKIHDDEHSQVSAASGNQEKARKPTLTSALRRFSFLGNLSRRASQKSTTSRDHSLHKQNSDFTAIDEDDNSSTQNNTIDGEHYKKTTEGASFLKEMFRSNSEDNVNAAAINFVPFKQGDMGKPYVSSSRSSTNIRSNTPIKSLRGLFPAFSTSASSASKTMNNVSRNNNVSESNRDDLFVAVRDPYDTYPNYDQFEADFDERGLLEKHYSIDALTDNNPPTSQRPSMMSKSSQDSNFSVTSPSASR
jgi:hypothetical protein